jgi:predicted flavoprotein YhiN
MAGKGGMNITHSEPFDAFLARYGARREALAPMLEAFGPEALREWMRGLGIESFVGSSGRVFPKEMKAAPLLRAWLHRLRQQGGALSCPASPDRLERPATATRLRFRDARRRTHRSKPIASCWRWAAAAGPSSVRTDAGLACWNRPGYPVAPLRPANCGFDTDWSPIYASALPASQ